MPNDILDLIDAAVSDWESGPDAVRYNGPTGPATPRGRVSVGAGNLVLTGPVMVIGSGPAFPVFDLELVTQPLVDHFAGMRETLRTLNARLAEFSVSMQLTPSAFAQLARVLGIAPRHGNPGADPCACRPVPFPAAWDYRRRTRHRSRRKR